MIISKFHKPGITVLSLAVMEQRETRGAHVLAKETPTAFANTSELLQKILLLYMCVYIHTPVFQDFMLLIAKVVHH